MPTMQRTPRLDPICQPHLPQGWQTGLVPNVREGAQEIPHIQKTRIPIVFKSCCSTMLTNRENHLMCLLAEGLTTHQAASKMFISPKTAQVYATRLRKKFGAATQIQLGMAIGVYRGQSELARRQGLMAELTALRESIDRLEKIA